MICSTKAKAENSKQAYNSLKTKYGKEAGANKATTKKGNEKKEKSVEEDRKPAKSTKKRAQSNEDAVEVEVVDNPKKKTKLEGTDGDGDERSS